MYDIVFELYLLHDKVSKLCTQNYCCSYCSLILGVWLYVHMKSFFRFACDEVIIAIVECLLV